MMRAGTLILVMALGACASAPEMAACPMGQEELRTAQLFLGRGAPKSGAVEQDIRRFVDEEISPRFPDGVTVMDGGGAWKGSENLLVREATKVVLIVMPRTGGPERVEAVRAAYRSRFQQDTALLINQSSCADI